MGVAYYFTLNAVINNAIRRFEHAVHLERESVTQRDKAKARGKRIAYEMTLEDLDIHIRSTASGNPEEARDVQEIIDDYREGP